MAAIKLFAHSTASETVGRSADETYHVVLLPCKGLIFHASIVSHLLADGKPLVRLPFTMSPPRRALRFPSRILISSRLLAHAAVRRVSGFVGQVDSYASALRISATAIASGAKSVTVMSAISQAVAYGKAVGVSAITKEMATIWAAMTTMRQIAGLRGVAEGLPPNSREAASRPSISIMQAGTGSSASLTSARTPSGWFAIQPLSASCACPPWQATSTKSASNTRAL